MKPLHRPMFRYGGPIKEGVMSGIRESHAGGGRTIAGGNQIGTPMGNRTGFANPKDKLVMGGLTKFLPQIGLKPGFMKPWWNKIKKTFGTTAQAPYTPVHQVQSKGGKLLNLTPKWRTGGTGPNPVDVGKVWTPKGWVARDPVYKLGSKIYEGKGYIGKPIKGLYNLAKTPTGGIGLVWMGGSWLWPDGTPANENEINEHLNKGGGKSGGVPGGGDQGMKGDGSWFAEQEKIAKQKEWNARIKKYRDIMDIKGMNKDAAYKSLVDASKLIQESQDFKGDIKSGKLINEVIQAASKQFDKPAKTSDAINTLILQNELKKDLESETNKDKKTLLKKQIQIADKTLQGATFSEVITDRIKRGEVPTGNTLATILRATEGIDAKVIPSSKLGEGEDPISFLEKQVAQAKEDGTFQPGAVVISSRVLIVDEAGNIKPFL